MASLYAKYVKEREGNEVIETEKGFIEYQVRLPYVYIHSIYVLPKYRKSGYASQLADIVAKLAKGLGASHLYSEVHMHTLNWRDSEKAIRAYGFKMQAKTNGVKIFLLNLKGG